MRKEAGEVKGMAYYFLCAFGAILWTIVWLVAFIVTIPTAFIDDIRIKIASIGKR